MVGFSANQFQEFRIEGLAPLGLMCNFPTACYKGDAPTELSQTVLNGRKSSKRQESVLNHQMKPQFRNTLLPKLVNVEVGWSPVGMKSL